MNHYRAGRYSAPDGSESGPWRIWDAHGNCIADAAPMQSTACFELVRQAKAAKGLADTLLNVLEYFEQREDVTDGSYGVPQPNVEMSYAARIREALRVAGVPT